jgi:two-component system cell cycle response regulator DivK
LAGALILIVEDNEKNRKLVRTALQLKGYQTMEATTAEEGLVIARGQKPALILMDIQLPGMDGVAALGLLRADPKTQNIPAIAVTASALPGDIQRIRDAGFDTYQTKPIRVKDFTEAVQQVLDRSKGA